ncbi:hypothetical protein ABPG72_015072 [Tetrahymena utriculariae]
MQNQEIIVKINGYYTQNGSEHKMDLAALHLTSDGTIHTEGHDTVGNFVIDGKIAADGKVHFNKQYVGKHCVVYEGALEDRVIKGTWKLNNLHDAFRLEVQAEIWEGTYNQHGSDHKMVAYFGFDDNKRAFGIGHDEIGSSIWSGEFVGDELHLVKQYVGKHKVTYKGKHTQDEFQGNWQTGGAHGTFHIHRK